MKIKSISHVLAGGTELRKWEVAADGTHVALPLDGSVSDDMVDLMCRELYGSDWDTIGPSFRVANRCHARAAIAALAAALGEEG